MKIINYTPHQVDIIGGVSYPSQGSVRLSTFRKNVGILPDGTPLTKTEYGAAEGLPEPQKDVMYIVSSLVKTALPDRKDLLAPADLIRDKNGRVIGCKSLDL